MHWNYVACLSFVCLFAQLSQLTNFLGSQDEIWTLDFKKVLELLKTMRTFKVGLNAILYFKIVMTLWDQGVENYDC